MDKIVVKRLAFCHIFLFIFGLNVDTAHRVMLLFPRRFFDAFLRKIDLRQRKFEKNRRRIAGDLRDVADSRLVLKRVLIMRTPRIFWGNRRKN